MENKALQDIFFEWRDTYDIQFIFNNKKIKNCFITRNASYDSIEKAIEDLIANCNLSYKKRGKVFVILPEKKKKKQAVKPTKKTYNFSGLLIDDSSSETLPAAVIQYENQYITSDATGSFAFHSLEKSAKVSISYLGYYKKDTILISSKKHCIPLESAQLLLGEAVVKDYLPIFDIHIGQTAGQFKLNHNITSFLAGNQNNSIYNMLRLQAGIMASGEQSNDYTIWGSYQGQTCVYFDHIRLFNISSFDDNQSVVHPLIIKDIEVRKGGYTAEHDNSVGGIVHIIGKNGDTNQTKSNINLNNQSVSAYLNVPLGKNLTLQGTYRQTYPTIFEKDASNIEKNEAQEWEYLEPNFSFRDFNLKLSGKTNKTDNFYVSILHSNDNFDYEYKTSETESEIKNSYYEEESNENRRQYGISALYNKHFAKGGFTNFVVSFSELQAEINRSVEFDDLLDKEEDEEETEDDGDDFSIEGENQNGIINFDAQITHFLPARKHHQFSFGAKHTYNTTNFETNIENYDNNGLKKNSEHRLGFFANDELHFSKKLSVKAGFRLDYPLHIGKLYAQPRLNLTYRMAENWTFNAAAGRYHQFIVKNSIIDDFENFLYVWNLANNDVTPVLSAMHYTTSFLFHKPNFKFQIEGFYKNIDNISIYRFDVNKEKLTQSIGDSRILGLDLYMKTKIKRHELSTAYTLNRTLEYFSHFTAKHYQLAPHNQTHELKTAAVFNFSPFYFSTNYIYGSGLQLTENARNNGRLVPYKRLDMAVLYRLQFKKTKLDISFSVLNLLDNTNVKYNDFINLPDEEIVYSEAMRRRFLLNLHFDF
ncbi:MAG: TonB-dependent receptor plug domain-containing protein [Chitinophagales bacterium]